MAIQRPVFKVNLPTMPGGLSPQLNEWGARLTRQIQLALTTIQRFQGVPTGGNTNSYLVKASNADHNLKWSDDGVQALVNTQTGTSYTTVDSDSGKVITLNNGSAITLTIHAAAPAGFQCKIIQVGAGLVTVAAGGTGNVRNASSHTDLNGQYAVGEIFVVSNAGTAPEVYLSGDTAP